MSRVKRQIKRASNAIEESESASMIAKSVNLTLQFKVIASSGDKDRERTYEQYLGDIRNALATIGVDHVTPVGGYYIIDGKVCLPEDYDPETQNRKPGTRPPVWAMSESDKEQAKILERIERERGLSKLSRQPPNLATAAETPKGTGRVGKGSVSSSRRRTGYDWDSRPSSTKDLVSVAPVTSVDDDDYPDLEWDLDDVNDVEKVDTVTRDATTRLRKSSKRVVRKR
jgi:hypothetical protein